MLPPRHAWLRMWANGVTFPRQWRQSYNHFKGLNYQDPNQAPLWYIFMEFSQEQYFFLDLINKSYDKDTFYVLLHTKCQLHSRCVWPCSFRCSLWNKLVPACSNTCQLSIIMTHASPTQAIKRLSKQSPIVDGWTMMTQQTCWMGHHRASLTAKGGIASLPEGK